jgi:lipopolysaccharide transport system ATP-binding protein
MSEFALEIKNVSKLYKLGVISTGTLSHDLNRWWHMVRGLDDPYERIAESNIQDSKGESGYIWALKDVSFNVPHGTALGIIGKNGAGKSTLLKILSRVTSLTKGEIRINGRIASLLEVGTGFHPELTGRENIFLNGAILGMKKTEIHSKLDEIIAFSGVEKYVDTPVKRYSSGMRVRLAFAVAAHLEPEILVVDEVLAVGDAEFQRKAIGKMQDVTQKEGRTILFVSHNMGAIKSLCQKGLVMSNGNASSLMKANDAVARYMSEVQVSGLRNEYVFYGNASDYNVRIVSAKIVNQNDNSVFLSGDKLIIKIDYNSDSFDLKGDIHLGIYDVFGMKIIHLAASFVTGEIIKFKKDGQIICVIPRLPLMPGRYSMNISLQLNGTPHHRIRPAFEFIVEAGDFFRNGRVLNPDSARFLMDSIWSIA